MLTKFALLRVVFTNGEIPRLLSYGRRLNDKPSDYFAFRRIDNISSIMKSPTEIHSNSAIELQVYHLMTCYHNFCIMSPLSRQQSFPLQVKRICRDSSFVTLMSFSAKLSSQIFLSLFRIPRQNSQLFSRPFTYCEAIRHVISVESWQVESWPSNHVWKSGCIHSNEISCNCHREKISLLRKIWCYTNLPHGQWSAIHQHIKD